MGNLVMLRIGVLGISEGNGHPFSFSAILNGFSSEGFRRAGWPGIHDYLRAKDDSEIGTLDARATHVWAPDVSQARAIAEACLVETVVADPAEMLGSVDAAMILRDDPESHLGLAKPFLDAGLPVFIDKPLTLDPGDLRFLGLHGRAGRVFSASGFRFARELDPVRVAVLEGFHPVRATAAVVNDWRHYGVHMIDAFFSLTAGRPLAVTACPSPHESFAIEMDDGCLFQVDCVGAAAKVFRLDLYGGGTHERVELQDNFSAFRRTLARFIQMVKTGAPPIPWDDTVLSMKTLMAGVRSRAEGRTVALAEIDG